MSNGYYKEPVTCTLCEARSLALQSYSYEQQMNLKKGLDQCKPTCGFGFASILPRNAIQNVTITPFGAAPKGSILSYQSLVYV